MLNVLLDLLFPFQCVVCGVPGKACCESCQELLQPIWHQTQLKGLRVWSMFPLHQPGVEPLVHALKYGGRTRAVKTVVQKKGVHRVLSKGLLFPVPISWPRRRQRGYAQAEVLASAFSSVNHIKVAPVLVRTDGESLVGKSRIEREQLVQGVFRVAGPIPQADRTGWLVDDVLTTGSTLQACAQALRKGGWTAPLAAVTLAFEE